ncbi:MAG: cobyrinate a,c-diamide synthase [Planctomycetota bacterium]|jgi:cobyrinic acid a,c-diamide synthase
MNAPRILVAGLRGGSGKTVVAASLAAAWRKQGRAVAPFKKGPDYIDAAWLTRAAGGRPCRNLDLFFMNREVIRGSFLRGTAGADVAVIEGNRGLYDGMDAKGYYSTAELAKHLKAPIVHAIDCTKSTGTVAAVALGCMKLDPAVPIRAVVLNRVRTPRHEAVLREAVTSATGLPVMGAVPRIPRRLFPERHLGLVPPEEHGDVSRVLEDVASIVEENMELEALWALASSADPFEPGDGAAPSPRPSVPVRARIGVVRDAAFHFYYPENLEALEDEGAELVEVSALGDDELVPLDGLYIGGGFPETAAPWLSANVRFRESLRRSVEEGLPVYAECGGAVYLGETLLMEGKEYPMAGVFPVAFGFDKKPQGHGYALLEAVEGNPYFPAGRTVRGHEFHYTFVRDPAAGDLDFAFHVHRGYGMDGRRDGLRRGDVLAAYTHIHALGVPSWAPAFVDAAVRFKAQS